MLMKRIATYRFLILVLALSAVLSLPGGLLAAVGAQAAGCPHCQGASPGLVAGCCCCGPDMPGHCGASGKDGGVNCPCGSANLASFSIPVIALPAVQDSPYVLATGLVSARLFTCTIFHPPESSLPASQG